MRIDLLELLASQPIVHPTQIKSIRLANGSMTMRLTGYPWWKPHHDFAERAELAVVFEGLSQGLLDVTFANGCEDDEEDLEDFSVQSLESVGWAQPCNHHIYGSSPLPNALLLYAVLKDYLVELGAYRQPEDFLNFDFDGKMQRFQELMSANSYLVARAPESICNVLCQALSRQGVPHNVLKTFEIAPEQRLWVRLGRGDFLCDSANAVFDEGDD